MVQAEQTSFQKHPVVPSYGEHMFEEGGDVSDGFSNASFFSNRSDDPYLSDLNEEEVNDDVDSVHADSDNLDDWPPEAPSSPSFDGDFDDVESLPTDDSRDLGSMDPPDDFETSSGGLSPIGAVESDELTGSTSPPSHNDRTLREGDPGSDRSFASSVMGSDTRHSVSSLSSFLTPRRYASSSSPPSTRGWRNDTSDDHRPAPGPIRSSVVGRLRPTASQLPLRIAPRYRASSYLNPIYDLLSNTSESPRRSVSPILPSLLTGTHTRPPYLPPGSLPPITSSHAPIHRRPIVFVDPQSTRDPPVVPIEPPRPSRVFPISCQRVGDVAYACAICLAEESTSPLMCRYCYQVIGCESCLKNCFDNGIRSCPLCRANFRSLEEDTNVLSKQCLLCNVDKAVSPVICKLCVHQVGCRTCLNVLWNGTRKDQSISCPTCEEPLVVKT